MQRRGDGHDYHEKKMEMNSKVCKIHGCALFSTDLPFGTLVPDILRNLTSDRSILYLFSEGRGSPLQKDTNLNINFYFKASFASLRK